MPFFLGIVIFMICHFGGLLYSWYAISGGLLYPWYAIVSPFFGGTFQPVLETSQLIFRMFHYITTIYSGCYLNVAKYVTRYVTTHVSMCYHAPLTLFFLRFSTSQTVAVVTVATWQPFCWPWSYYLCWQPTCVCSALRCVRSSKNPAPSIRRRRGTHPMWRMVVWRTNTGNLIFTNTTWWFYQHKFGVIVHITDFC